MSNRTLVTTVATAVATLLAGSQTFAQQEAESSLVLEEVTVTARKTEERLIEAPLSITAFTAADIEKKGFATLEDVARSAPGVQYSNQGGQIPGRYTSAIRCRAIAAAASSLPQPPSFSVSNTATSSAWSLVTSPSSSSVRDGSSARMKRSTARCLITSSVRFVT